MEKTLTPGEVRFSNNFKESLKKHLNRVSSNESITEIDELEFRLGQITFRGFTPKFRMPTFRRIVNYLQETYPTVMDGPKQPTESYQLDVTLNSREYPQLTPDLRYTRVRVEGRQNIQRFCKTNDQPLCRSYISKRQCHEDQECIWMHPEGTCGNKSGKSLPVANIESKIKQEKLDMEEYDLRLQSSMERRLASRQTIERVWKMIKSKRYNKFYRYKKRYSWIVPGLPVRFDLSVVKEASGPSFELANVLNAREKYEIEMEYLEKVKFRSSPGQPVLPEKVDRMTEQIYYATFDPLRGLIKAYQEAYEIMSNSEVDQVKKAYANLIGYPKNPFFIGMDLVALQTKDLLPDPKTKRVPLFDKWVTPKADGVRHLAYVYDGENPALTGNIYILNNRLQPRSTGAKSKLTGSIFDGEYLKMNTGEPAVLLFDTFFKGNGSGAIKIKDGKPDSAEDAVQNPVMIAPGKSDIRSLDLEKRLSYIDEFLGVNGQNIEYPGQQRVRIEKKAYKSLFTKAEHQELAEDNEGMTSPLGWNKVFIDRDWGFPFDGLIFTPGGPYPVLRPKAGRRWDETVKWKPQDMLSNDYLVQIKKNKQRRDIIYTDETGKQYKLLILKNVVYENGQKLFVKFSGSPPFREGLDNTARVYLESDGSLKTNPPKGEERHAIYDNSVIEFIWDGGVPPTGGWRPIRFREDKTDTQKPNHLDTARSNWKIIVNPITEAMITGEEPVPVDYYAKVDYNLKNLTKGMRLFHNKIKRELLKSAANSARVLPNRDNDQEMRLLDLGAGQGGDLEKWLGDNPERPLYDYILALEYNLNNLIKSAGAMERYKRLLKRTGTKMIVEWIWGDATRNLRTGAAGQKSEVRDEGAKLRNLFLEHNLGANAFDVISCQFAIHYFFKDIKFINNFFYNVYQNLRNGGYLIGTTLMGDHVMGLLEGLEIDESRSGSIGPIRIWEIIRRYYGEDPMETGQEIAVYNSSINGDAMSEWLVHFKYLKDLARKFGLVSIGELEGEEEMFGVFKNGTGSFEELYPEFKQYNKMSKDEETYSFLNGFFIFKLDEDLADAAYIQNVSTDLDYVVDEIDQKLDPRQAKLEAEAQEVVRKDAQKDEKKQEKLEKIVERVKEEIEEEKAQEAEVEEAEVEEAKQLEEAEQVEEAERLKQM